MVDADEDDAENGDDSDCDDDSNVMPSDSDGDGEIDWHGTAVAGIASAKGNNSLGVSGVSYKFPDLYVSPPDDVAVVPVPVIIL